MVTLTKVSTECQGDVAYREEESMTTLGAAINHRVLWSAYKVRLTKPMCPSVVAVVKEERIGGPPIHLHPDMEDQSSSDSDTNATAPDDGHGRQSDGPPNMVNQRDGESANANLDRPL